MIKFLKKIFAKKRPAPTTGPPQKTITAYAKGMEDHKYDYVDYFTDDLVEWIGRTNDAVLLASGYCMLNCFEYPDFMPKPNEGCMIQEQRWESEDYKSIKFINELMYILKIKADHISPGIVQLVWTTKYYRKFNSIIN
jgi:hypothetical protein